VSAWTEEKLFSSKSNEWSTPQALYDRLNREFKFDVDVAASELNHKCPTYWTQERDALNLNWAAPYYQDGGRFWCNPPYGRVLDKWVRKCYRESRKGCLVVALLFARTDTAWFHDYCMEASEIRFIRGRLQFTSREGKTGQAPAPSMVVVWDGRVGPRFSAMERP
jgi:phage N-6-adenine-methyltransferase